jgi:hypothetical protein
VLVLGLVLCMRPAGRSAPVTWPAPDPVP